MIGDPERVLVTFQDGKIPIRTALHAKNTTGIITQAVRVASDRDTFDATGVELTSYWHAIGQSHWQRVYKTSLVYHPLPSVIVMDKVQSKFKKTKRSFVYHYLFSPALPGKPTLLFIHGFPSTSYDWYQQINYFQPKGYGLVVPDLLGFGRTEPKSNNPADFLHTAIGEDLLDILDEEDIKNVIAIGHDWHVLIRLSVITLM